LKTRRFTRLLGCAGALALVCALRAGAEEPAAPPKAEDAQPPAAAKTAPAAPAAAPETAKAAEAPPSSVEDVGGIRLSLEDCIEIAVQNNLNLKLDRLSDRGSDYSVQAAWAKFYPVFTTGFTHSNSSAALPSSGAQQSTLSFDMTQNSPWGTVLDFSTSETRSIFNPDGHINVAGGGVVSNPASGLSALNITQPLWRGAGPDVGLAAIRTARIQRLITRSTLDLDTQKLIFTVKSSYADVIRLLQEREVDRQAVRSAQKFLELTIAQEEAGKVTKLDVSNAGVQLGNREKTQVTNERQLGTSRDTLKQIMDVDLEEKVAVDAPIINFGENPAEKTLQILVSDEKQGTVTLVTRKEELGRDREGAIIGEPKVLFTATRFDEVEVFKQALANRTDLLNAHRTLALQKIKTLVAKNGLGYQVDLQAGVSRSYGGRSLVEADNGSERNGWVVGVNATVPWGKISDRAAYELALLDLQKTEINLKAARTQVQFDVRDVLRRLHENEKSILIQAQVVENSKRAREAAQISFERGLKDSFDVIKAEDDLLAAKTLFVQDTLAYVVQVAAVELAIGKPTGRVDVTGQSPGGEVLSKVSEELQKRGLPALAPNAEARPEDDPRSQIRDYRVDPKPKPKTRLQVAPIIDDDPPPAPVELKPQPDAGAPVEQAPEERPVN
jgi:outer membrane protein TolC